MLSLNETVGFDGSIFFRDSAERLAEEVYRSIPALNDLSLAAIAVSNKLSHDARDALFFERGRDPGLRAALVESAIYTRQSMETVSPDQEWLLGADKPSRKDFETPDNDVWLDPTPD